MFIAMIYKESQIGRSLGTLTKGINDEFKIRTFAACKLLRQRVDEESLKNHDIRKEIMDLSRDTGTSIGQSQKVINVFLKFYCLLTNKPDFIIRELDCPLDSNSISDLVQTKERKKLKDIKNIDDYSSYQQKAEEKYVVRLLADKKYDLQRLANYSN